MHIHILGICGTFMAGIASLAKSKGFGVTGCDQNVYPPMSTQLEGQGILIIEGFYPSQVELNPNIYLVGNIFKSRLLYTSFPSGEHPQINTWSCKNIKTKQQTNDEGHE